jgi:hypothetical protein
LQREFLRMLNYTALNLQTSSAEMQKINLLYEKNIF